MATPITTPLVCSLVMKGYAKYVGQVVTENYKIIKFVNDINAFNNKYNTKYINIYMYNNTNRN